jgi:hypothetical protein
MSTCLIIDLILAIFKRTADDKFNRLHHLRSMFLPATYVIPHRRFSVRAIRRKFHIANLRHMRAYIDLPFTLRQESLELIELSTIKLVVE